MMRSSGSILLSLALKGSVLRGAVAANSAAAALSTAASSACEGDEGHGWWGAGGSALRIALVRHGESMNNVHEAVSEANYHAHREADPDLSARGFAQAGALGSFLADPTASAFLGIHPVDELWVRCIISGHKHPFLDKKIALAHAALNNELPCPPLVSSRPPAR